MPEKKRTVFKAGEKKIGDVKRMMLKKRSRNVHHSDSVVISCILVGSLVLEEKDPGGFGVGLPVRLVRLVLGARWRSWMMVVVAYLLGFSGLLRLDMRAY